jgi:5-methylthioadenosine/S-adenosylhomocysteine deaminase
MRLYANCPGTSKSHAMAFMEQVDTLICARWILPIEPAGCVLEHHAVAVSQGRIVAVLPQSAARARFDARTTIERPTHVLLPGLVNTHTHAAMTLLRGAAEANSLDPWLKQQIWPLEQRWMDAQYVRDGTELAIAELLTSGTTCFADMHLFPEVVAQVASAMQIRASIGLPVVDSPTVWATSAGEYLDKGLQLHDDYRGDPLITTTLAPYAPWAVSDETLTRVRRIADELELPMMMHVNESRTEPSAPPGSAGNEPALARLERLGVLSPLLTAVHMVHLDAADLDRAARGGINVAHCPQSNLKLGNGVSPVPRLRAAGVNLTLGTDGAASNNDLNLLDEMRTAALLARGLFPQAPQISAHDWLQVATLNGARALGLGDTIGSIVPDKWADMCCINLHAPQTLPVHDPAVHIVYSVSRDQVSDVWVAGRALVRDRQLTRMDLNELTQRVQHWQQRISGSTSLDAK